MTTTAREPSTAPHDRSWRLGVRIRHEHRTEVTAGIVIVLVTSLLPFALGSVYWQQAMLLVDLYVAAAVFLNILRGEGGQIHFGLAAVFGAAAYTEGMAATICGLNFWLSLAIGVVIGFVFGTVTALPALRVQSYYLGFITLAVAVVLPAMLLNYNDFTHAASGIPVVSPGMYTTTVWGMNWVDIVAIILAALSFVIHAVVRASRFGRHLKVAADSPEAAASLGMRPGVLRLAAFGLASLGASLCGALYVPATGFISPGAFPFTLSILFYFAVIVGGAGSIVGPLLGIYLLYLVPNVVFSGLAQYRLLIYGCIAFIVMLIFPDGIIGFLRSRFASAGTIDPDLGERLSEAMLSHHADAPLESRRSDEPALTVTDAARQFGNVHALDGASLEIHAGTVHGLVGANGSGKTTLLNAISGFITLDRGSVHVTGQDITTLSATRRARNGLGRTFQAPRVFEDMSLQENLHLDTPPDHQDLDTWQRWDQTSAQALTHGQRRLTELYRVLTRRPSVLLLDEPAAGLSASERDELGQVLTRLAQDGVAVLLVEHDLTLVWNIAHTVSVMELGKVVRTGTPSALADDPVIDSLLGGVSNAQR
ncbi:ABC transporter permease subunit [Leekyejoonella antrihumi]|uniref:ATP-binding cassette domain-containing protein n=1 Tax=Leekyejoonella antrihumi TaxID=1660198 RepID=A0A563DTJ9_9MICO|nr:ATP-binding cassette domain-containing protein [Leekyejoonella antrihumi]TWP33252.1 ATP-binding cassette domain-containing protein [Leekyejoonella antrihumi]